MNNSAALLLNPDFLSRICLPGLQTREKESLENSAHGTVSPCHDDVKVLEKTPQNAHPMCYCHQLRNQEDARPAF